MSPAPGTINNVDGVNGWEGFADEEPYGQVTKNKALRDSAPLAGGRLSVGAIAAPKRAQRRAASPPTTARVAAASMPLPAPPTAAPSVADVWRQIAATPGAENYPILQQLAEEL